MVSKMVRTICCEKTGLKRGAWTAEEDRKLTAYIKRYGHWNWRELPKYAGLARCGKSCRLRWMNYLRPNIKRGNYSAEEEEIIINLHESLGNKWAVIASKLPGRTDNEIKNHWHTNLKKRMKQNPTTSEPKLHPSDGSKVEANTKKESEPSSSLPNAQTHQILESSLLSPQLSSSSTRDFSSMLTDSPVEASTNWVADENKSSLAKFAEPIGDFWTEPYLAGNSYVQEDYPETLMDPRFVFSPSFVSLEEPLCAYINDDMDWLYQSMQEELPKF